MPLMCNSEVEYCFEELPICYDQLLHQGDPITMDTTLSRTNSVGNDENNPRAKFLCSFGGCVLPRPQDGKLRYVGGETRIVSVPRSIGYEELMDRMREIYEEASILKYQQPDEDLDALVSVVNHDDVVNMMEEYDKLGSGDGLTRLRIFLFSHLDQDASPRYMEADERDSERRYVDALNSSTESPEYRRQNPGDSPTTTPFDEIHIADQFFNSMNLDVSVHNQRNYEMGLSPYNMGQLASQHTSSIAPLHNEEASWSPAGYSPSYAGPHDMHSYTELGPPSCGRFRVAYQEMAEECNHQQANSQIPFDHRQPYSDQVVWLPTGAVPVERGAFHGNMFNGPNAVDCPSVCQHCKTSFHRISSSPDFHKKPEDPVLVEQSTMGNGLTKVVRTGNMPYMQGADTPNQVFHGNTSMLPNWRDAVGSLQVFPHEPSLVQTRNSVPNLVPTPRGVVEGSPRILIGVDQGSWVESPQRRLGGDASILPEYSYGHLSMLSPHPPFQEIQQTLAQDPLRNPPNMVRPFMESSRPSGLPSTVLNANYLSSNGQLKMQDTCNVDDVCPTVQNNKAEDSTKESLSAGILKVETIKSSSATNGDVISSVERIASAGEAKLEGVVEVKVGAHGDEESVVSHNALGEAANTAETEPLDVKNHSEGGSDNDCAEGSVIESTKAEEEAVAEGLQAIKNGDLEEVRELGTGTYGAVYHGKWKGSDVAIKRIKASCFAGRPSERQRLIADFWKEALILSSLHHPNVVSFYGVVRDGPDGSLATVTEFMVNGSLKQYLRKKDRTIDRRKRLIIAMDAAFGMEYLHEKNIVHFDLKCENLLVNMRDPHRPVCKIGDLGLSKVKQHTLVSGGVRGTLPWMAPELLSGKSHMVTEKIDVYSFGIVMWELLTGEEPYSDMHSASLIGGIVNNTLRPQIPTWCDPEWKWLMQSCWASEPAERPSFLEISQKLRTMAAAMNVK